MCRYTSAVAPCGSPSESSGMAMTPSERTMLDSMLEPLLLTRVAQIPSFSFRSFTRTISLKPMVEGILCSSFTVTGIAEAFAS